MLSRRRILGLLSGSVAGWIGLIYACKSNADAIVTVVQTRLNYLKLDPTGVRQFATDLVAKGLVSSDKLRIVNLTGSTYQYLPINRSFPLANALRHGEDRVITYYLLSTDFFLGGSDEARTVHYLGFYDPLHACANPFARPVFGHALT